MPYRPDYCNYCGEKVERIVWKLWTSEHFCQNCESLFRKVDWKSKISLIFGFFGVIFGIGSYLKAPDKSLNLTTNQFSVSAANKNSSQKNEQISVNSNAQNSANKTNVNTNSVSQNQTKKADESKSLVQTETKNPQIVESEPVYFCGAQTKKGTPCTRKVKGGGRCWQHTGLPAMLPKEKLIFSQ